MAEDLADDQSFGAWTSLAQVHVSPYAPERTEIKITPLPESNLRLLITRSPQPGVDPGGTFELPMDDVTWPVRLR